MLYSQMCWDYTTICVRVIFAYLGTPRSRKAGLCVRITGWFLLLAHYLQSRIMTSGHGLADFAVLMVFDVEKEVEIKLGGRTDHAHTISKRGSPPLPNFTTLTTTSSDDAPETRQIEYPPDNHSKCLESAGTFATIWGNWAASSSDRALPRPRAMETSCCQLRTPANMRIVEVPPPVTSSR
jgi:hypothetical protein